MFKKKKIQYFNPLLRTLEGMTDDELNSVVRHAYDSYTNEYKRQKGNRSDQEVPQLNHVSLQATLPLVLHEQSFRFNKKAVNRSIYLAILSLAISLVSLYISFNKPDHVSYEYIKEQTLLLETLVELKHEKLRVMTHDSKLKKDTAIFLREIKTEIDKLQQAKTKAND